MSKMSKLDSGLGTSYGGLSGSKLSSRLSAQSKQKLFMISSADKKIQFEKFYKDIAINKEKVMEDEEWLQDRLNSVLTEKQKSSMITQSQVSIYGRSLLKLHDSVIVHSYLFANLSDKINKEDFEALKSTQVICQMKEPSAKTNSIKSIYQN